MNKCKNCGKQVLAVNGEWVHRSPFPNCNNPELDGNIQETHEKFVNEVLEKTKSLTVPEESDECMREGYEHDPKVRGPRSRPEQARRLKKAFKEYEDKFDADGSMVAATKDVLSEERMIEEMIVEKEKELELMHENNDSGEHISMAKKELRELKYKLKKTIYNDANCEGGEK